MQKKYLYSVFILFILLAAACSKKDAASVSDTDNKKLESKILELEKISNEQQEIINKQEEQLIKEIDIELLQNKIDHLESQVLYLDNRLFITEKILNKISASKTAILKDTELNGNLLELKLTYTNKIQDETAPNGYRLEETSEGTKTLSISKGIPIFLLEDPSTLKVAEWEQLKSHQRLLQLFEKNGEVVFIIEMYLP